MALVECSFNALVTIAIADASARLSMPIEQLFDSTTWLEDWTDALLCAEGELQVATELMVMKSDDRLPSRSDQLRAVRRRLHESRSLLAARRRREHELDIRQTNDAEATARKWLHTAFRDEWTELLQQILAEQGLNEPLPSPSRDSFDLIELRHAHGFLDHPVTDEVRRLNALPDEEFRNVVAIDAKNQEDRIEELMHPLLIRRWSVCLQDLAQMTYTLAGAKTPEALGPTPPILLEPTANPEDAYAVVRARRFLAAVNQRRIECARMRRHLVAESGRNERRDPTRIAYTQAQVQASRLLVDRRPKALAYILEQLRPYETTPGVLDSALLPEGNRRGQVKRDIINTLTGFQG
ncbi:hypothetical protein [Nocardia carnea]|uniref:hypothetical protein n=1 Tax=Nocardia carnea TaxID=37328 RepID=UPI002458139B|nr:hypothetical protein [Nocardia carnea]